MNKAIYKPVIRSIKKQLNKNKIMAEAIDIRELNERIERQSAFVTNLMTGMDQVIIGQKHLVESLKKNMIILQIAYENQTVNYGKVLEEYKTICSYDTIGLEELATTSFALFEAIFSYGNDKFLENSNEYTFIPSDGLDYSTLDLSPINVLYINKDNGIKNSILIELASKKKKITEMDAKISKNEQSLLQVTKNGNLKAKSILQSNLKNHIKKEIDFMKN